MKAIIVNFWAICFLTAGVFSADAATHYLVPANPDAAAPYTSWETAGTSVIDVAKAAMTNATTPRIVLVTNGVYVLTNTVKITNGIVLKGVNGRDATIFNGNAAWRFWLAESSNCVLDGLTITNCYDSGSGGGGIEMSQGTITNCLVTDCVTKGTLAGGIRITGSGCIVANCTIRRNRMLTASNGGGGIHIGGSGYLSTIMNCIIESNLANNYGGGIMVAVHSVVIRNCLIRFNGLYGGSYYGGGINIGATNVLVANCTIVSNYASSAGGGINFSNFSDPAHTNTIINCIIVSNKCGGTAARDNIFDMSEWSLPVKHKYAIGYSCSTSNAYFVLDDRGNKTNDPNFTSFTGENYRFTRFSPCFNSGTNQVEWMNNAFDLDGHARILHGTVDMGAYELLIPKGTMFRIR